MEDYLELLIFLAFAAFSLLSRFLSPKKKPPTRAPEKTTRYDVEDLPESDKPVVAQEPPPAQPTSFEDILRELMGQRSSPRPTSPPPQPVQKAQEKARKKVEEVKQSAKKAKRIADKISLEDTGQRIQPVEIVDSTPTLAREVSEALKNPESAREAIILSEIINRKYF